MSKSTPAGVLLLVLLLLAACSSEDTSGPPPPPPTDPGLDLVESGVALLQRPVTLTDGADSLGFIQVLWKGELRVNPLGDPSVITTVDTLAASVVEQVKSLALDGSMVEIFKRSDAGCEATAGPIEELRLLQQNDLFWVKITGCTTGPTAELRDLLLSLTRKR